ncbi:MAG: hypothetical protein HC802_20015 [Caldilineaceae bacterium]|nr:hypothetical protein [Caldilineaceae bacterium]
MGTSGDTSSATIPKAIIRTGQPTRWAGSLATGLALTIALNAFILTGGLQILGAQTLTAYPIALLIFTPIVLTAMQYLTATRGSESLFDLFLRHGAGARAFLGTGLIYLGYAALMALLAWGAGALLSALLQTVAGVEWTIRLLATLALALLGLSHLLRAGRQRQATGGATHMRLVLGILLLLLLSLSLAQLVPADLASRSVSFALPRSGLVAMLTSAFWVIGIVFDGRQAAQQPGRSVLAVTWLAVGAGALAGLVAYALPHYPTVIWPSSSASVAVLTSATVPPVFMALFLAAGLTLIGISMERLLAYHLALHNALTDVGFLPDLSGRRRGGESGRSQG